jgi:hypothetical protein
LGKTGQVAFEVVDERQAPYRLVNHKPDHIVIDTQAVLRKKTCKISFEAIC